MKIKALILVIILLGCKTRADEHVKNKEFIKSSLPNQEVLVKSLPKDSLKLTDIISIAKVEFSKESAGKHIADTSFYILTSDSIKSLSKIRLFEKDDYVYLINSIILNKNIEYSFVSSPNEHNYPLIFAFPQAKEEEIAGFFIYVQDKEFLLYFGFGRVFDFSMKNLMAVSLVDLQSLKVKKQILLTSHENYLTEPNYKDCKFISEEFAIIHEEIKKIYFYELLNILDTKEVNSNNFLYPQFNPEYSCFPIWYWGGYYPFSKDIDGPVIFR